ncbi:MAG: tetratricopeptide repeat protein [Desulfatibacillum sp.]|nr:tetratricopeptide repeat protein [Desulfatibacillum sp.]
MKNLDSIMKDVEDLFDKGQYSKACSLLKELLGQDPNHFFGHFLLSLCLCKLQRFWGARQEAQITIELDPKAWQGHFAEAQALLGLERYQQAHRHAEYVLEMAPDLGSAHHLSAKLSLATGDFARAEESFKQAVQLSPRELDFLSDLAKIQLVSGKKEPARQTIEKILNAAPEHIDGQVLMGCLNLDEGRLQEASDYAIRALLQDHEHLGARRLMAEIKAQTNPLLGTWWKFNDKMLEFGQDKTALIVLVSYVIARFAINLANQGSNTLSFCIWFGFYGICFLAWLAPALFHVILKSELDKSRMKDL